MSADIRFDGRVAIVTGAGGGLGRSHALQLAARGAKVLVNDLGAARDGSVPGAAGESAADKVVAEIRAAGGEALANTGSVTDPVAVQAMIDQAMAAWGRVDILVNNAGILRDKSFSKMTLDDFRLLVDVHLMGAVYGTKAVWEIMKAQGYGRIIFTTSSSGLYGNFGQANYGAAKMALVGLMQTLALEGEKYNVRVNCLAPTAATRMTQDIMPPEVLKMLTPESVTPGVLFLASEQAPTRAILNAGAGVFAAAHITLTDGVLIGVGADAPEQVATQFAQINSQHHETVPGSGLAQSQQEIAKVMAKLASGG
ncbi:MAG: SDR family NAD(P)-dependent oxidoreductase [Aquabacterium sp.]|uniref:SDR family NAD(P)-dependent oxidoreductase n=1 Tax=Aquabacterium sp. TaxID=1872578 RepID=UPI001207EDB9|nr:SDR family NAD(P)-dependent oxidoreductase [Aquabacterium sp.]TAK96512.1 MAG: SDR family NAD(P)-dependent oxidoreductase [Aquabacterium sp.]